MIVEHTLLGFKFIESEFMPPGEMLIVDGRGYYRRFILGHVPIFDAFGKIVSYTDANDYRLRQGGHLRKL